MHREGRLRRLRWGAFGLRGRVLGTVFVTTVATLVVAGALVLPRLEGSLQKASRLTLQTDIRSRGSQRLIRAAANNLSFLIARGGTATKQTNLLKAEAGNFGTRLGSTVTLIGYIDEAGDGRRILPLPPAPSSPGTLRLNEAFPGVGSAYLDGTTPVYSFVTIAGKAYVQAIIPLPKPADAVFVAYKSTDDIPIAVSIVRQALEIAAGAGLLLSLLLGIPLAATIVRRLRRLREAALQLALQGDAPELPTDRARDEVADLARSFATMQDRLHHQEQARRAFVATASHELRTPLASLDGMLELLDEDLGEPAPDLDDARALLDRARVQSRRLGRLAADLLDLSRIDADVALRSEPIELGELSRAVMAEFDLASEERAVPIQLEEGAQPVWVLGDPGSVARIIRILLDNALRVAPEGTAVIVTTLGSGSRPRLTVSDYGPGVPAEERELIFERFKRGRDTHGQAGFGLGLAIGRELAERMGGHLRVTDTGAPGATFELELASAGLVPEDRPAAEPQLSSPSKSSATELMQ